MKGTPVPKDRWPKYQAVYNYKPGSSSYSNSSEITNIVETERAVYVIRREIYDNIEIAPKQAKNTLAKFICVGGPHSGDWFTTIEEPEDYFHFNAAAGSYRGRRAKPEAWHSMIFVHKSVL